MANNTLQTAYANGEIIDASHHTGQAIRKKEEIYRMAEANKAFAHHRF